MTEREQPAGLDLALDELIKRAPRQGGGGRGQRDRKGRGGGGGGGGGRGFGRGSGRGGYQQQDGAGQYGAIRQHGRQPIFARLQQPVPSYQEQFMGGGGMLFRPPLPQYPRAQPPLPAGPYSSGQYGRGAGPASAKPPMNSEYKQHEAIRKDDNGDVVLSLYGVDIVTVRPNGDVVLDAGKFRGMKTFQSMNGALNALGMKLVAIPEGSDNWQVSDGLRFLKRFENGMVVPAGASEGPGRGLALLAAHGDASAKATVASNAAAARAGIGGGAPWGGAGGRGRGGGASRYSPY